MFLVIILILVSLLGLFFVFWKNQGRDIFAVDNLLNDCNKQQSVINMPIFPGCYIGGLKKLNISKSEAKSLLDKELRKSGIYFDSIVKESKWWADPWNEYYGNN